MISVTFRGVNYQIPEPTDANNQALTDYLNALSTGAVPFPTTADIDLGSSWGLKALYFLTRAANAASNAAANRVRLALADLIAWRNNANNADLVLGVGAQDQLQWRGSDVTGNPFLFATTTAGQSIPNAANTIVVYGTVGTDTDSAYNAGTGRFTVPTGKGGHYHISAGVLWNASAGTAPAISIFLNAAQKIANQVNQTGTTGMLISGTLLLAAGDIVDIRVIQASGGAVVLSAAGPFNFFTIKKVPA